MMRVRAWCWTSLVVQGIRLRASNAEGIGLIPGRGTKNTHASWYDQNKNQSLADSNHSAYLSL